MQAQMTIRLIFRILLYYICTPSKNYLNLIIVSLNSSKNPIFYNFLNPKIPKRHLNCKILITQSKLSSQKNCNILMISCLQNNNILIKIIKKQFLFRHIHNLRNDHLITLKIIKWFCHAKIRSLKIVADFFCK